MVAMSVHRQRLECQWLLDMLARVLGFWTLRREYISLSDTSSTGLGNELERLKRSIAREYERRSTPDQRFTSMRPVVWDTQTTELATFKTNGSVTLEVTPEGTTTSLRGWAIAVDEVLVSLPGAKVDDDVLYVLLTHHGDGSVRDDEGTWRNVEFRPRKVGCEFDLDGTVIGRRGLLVDPEVKGSALTPYGHWTLEVREEDNPGLDLSEVNAIHIGFRGVSRA